jgi:epoxyqueuosine reductase
MTAMEEAIKDFARTVGFPLCGIAPATPADGFDRLTDWLNRGYAGEMAYMHRHHAARRHPESILATVRSVIMVGMEYSQAACGLAPTPAKPQAAKIARYAAGPDYHDVMWRKMDKLLAWLRAEIPGCQGRGVVDTAPLLERDFARRAGLGWIGKNTMLINKYRGSYFFLGAILTDLDLKPDPPHEADHCGTCTACLDACPTQAFTGPGWLDARRCIGYLTIELRGPIPADLREGVGDWLFGCDVCQEVCPWNRKDSTQPESVDALDVLALGEAEFRERYRGTALMRTKRTGLVRNAAVVLGNVGDERTLPALERARDDADAGVREAAEWAIGRIRERSADVTASLACTPAGRPAPPAG